MDLIQTFIDLTEYTIPHGNEHTIHSKLVGYLPKKIKMFKDGFGNLFCEVGKGSKTLFTSHMDTITKDGYTKVIHVVDEDYIRTNGKTILGGDNKAGVTILLWMINHDIPGTYYFFAGEEVGCLGSNWMLLHEQEKLKKFNKAIAFDRKEKHSIITFQMGTRTASDIFGNSLARAFNKAGLPYTIDPSGVKTDTAIFIDIIPECTNISAGVYGEHTNQEKLDIKYFLSLCDAVLKVDWENLTVSRDTSYKEKRPKKNNTTVGTSTYTQQQQIGYTKQTNSNINAPQLTLDIARDHNHDSHPAPPKEFTSEEMANIYFDRILRGTKQKRIGVDKKPYLLASEQTDFYLKFNALRKLYFEVDNLLDIMSYSTNSDFLPDTNIIYKSYDNSKKRSITVFIGWAGDLLLNGEKTDVNKIPRKLETLGSKIDSSSQEEPWKKIDFINNNKLYEYFGGSSDSKVSQLVFESKNGNIVVSDFIKNHGGDFDIFNTFITLPFITRDNFSSWPGYYKIYQLLGLKSDYNSYIVFINEAVNKFGGNLKKYLDFLSSKEATISNSTEWNRLYSNWLVGPNKVNQSIREKFKTDQDLVLLMNQLCNWVNRPEEEIIIFLNNVFDPNSEKTIMPQLTAWSETYISPKKENHLKELAIKKLQGILKKFSYLETERYIYNLAARFNRTEADIIVSIMDFGFMNTNELEYLLEIDKKSKKLPGVRIDGKSPEDFGIFEYSWNKGKLDCNQDVDISNNELKKMPFDFGKVEGEFRCSKNYFTDLVGSPTYIKNDMIISSNPYLENFEGITEFIGGNLIMYFMQSGNFDIEKYPMSIIMGGIVVDKPNEFEALNEYISINGLIKENHILFKPFLKDKKAFHQLVMKFKPEFIPLYSSISPAITKDKKSEERIVWKDLDCKSTLKNLTLGSYFIKGNFDCSGSGLITLLNSPLRVDKNYDCSNNKLTNLTHISSHIGGDVILTGNQLPMNMTAINDYPPIIVYGSFISKDNLYVEDIFNQLNDVVKLNVDKFKLLVGNKKEFHVLLKKLAPELFENISSDNEIVVGSTITLKSKENKTMVMTIVDYPTNGLKKIFIESVLGKKLSNSKLGDTITIISSEWEITNIETPTQPKNPKGTLDKLSHSDLVTELSIDKDNINLPIKKKAGVGSAVKVKIKHKYIDGTIAEYSIIFHIVDEKIPEDWEIPKDRSELIPIGMDSLLGYNLIGKEIGNSIEMMVPKHGYRQGTIVTIDNTHKPLEFGDDIIKLNSIVEVSGKFYPSSVMSKMIEYRKKITIINEELDDTSTIPMKKAKKWLDKKVGDTIHTTLYMDNAPNIPIIGNWEIVNIKNTKVPVKVKSTDLVTIKATFNIVEKTTNIFENNTNITETYGFSEKNDPKFTRVLTLGNEDIKPFIGKMVGNLIPFKFKESSTEFKAGKTTKTQRIYNTNWEIIKITQDIVKDNPILLEA